MTLELIIGKAGTPHIDGNDIGTLNQAIRGEGSYILDWGNNLTATVTGSNTVQIGTGAGTMEGRDFIISAAENVTIQSGSQGMKRNDLICLHYNRSSSTGVETMNLVALKGYATSSNPRDPSVPSGTIMGGSLDAYWPLYRVPLDGIRIGTPVRLVEMLPSLRNLHFRLADIRYRMYGDVSNLFDNGQWFNDWDVNIAAQLVDGLVIGRISVKRKKGKGWTANAWQSSEILRMDDGGPIESKENDFNIRLTAIGFAGDVDAGIQINKNSICVRAFHASVNFTDSARLEGTFSYRVTDPNLAASDLTSENPENFTGWFADMKKAGAFTNLITPDDLR